MTLRSTLARAYVASAFLALLLLAFPGAAHPEEDLLLKPLLDEALANNPEIRAMQERYNALRARSKAEGALDDPVLRIEKEEIPTGSPFELGSPPTVTRYSISQTFPFPGKKSLKEDIALKEAGAAKADLRAKELEVLESVKNAYYDYAFLDESIRVTREIKRLLEDMSRIAQSRYATGQVSQQDAIRVNVETAAINEEIISLEARKGIAASRLKALLDRPQDSDLPERAALPLKRAAIDIEELTRSALSQNPEVKALESEAEANELSARLAKKNYYPDFMVGVEPMERDGRFSSYGVMFQMNIPIWRGKYDSLSEEARAGARSAKARLLAAQNGKGFEVRSAVLLVEAAGRTIDLYETSLLPLVELSFESAVRNYQAGKVDFLTLLDTERELKRVRIDRVTAVAEYMKRLAALERVTGSELLP
ncbi:MAG: TolC family protein [Deltaproteobacteria bacterium]|nr:TolC family protein [Deltaproteobacteria bacterium]MBZ0220021.1 TolC family protein [Deltaproteobacteria bacterium]